MNTDSEVWSVLGARRMEERKGAVLAAALLLLMIFAAGCATTETPRIAGRVVDKQSGEPVVGADVMVYRKMWSPEWHGANHVNFGHRWQKTDENGRFDFPAARERTPHRRGWTWRLEDEPTVRVTDERYGTEAHVYRKQGWEDLERDFFIAMEITGPTELEAICDPDEEKRFSHFCAGLYPPGGPHCREVVREMRCPHD